MVARQLHMSPRESNFVYTIFETFDVKSFGCDGQGVLLDAIKVFDEMRRSGDVSLGMACRSLKGFGCDR